MNEHEEEALVRLCTQIGATSEQAPLMARKLKSRARQLAESRGITEVEAMEYLLRLLTSGQGVNSSTDSAWEKGSGLPPFSKK